MKFLSPAIVEVTRGDFVESTHLVDIVVADSDGGIVASWGEPERIVFPRSSVKAIQALPLVESGAADAFGFKPMHLALACASHNGEQAHVDCANEMLKLAGLSHTCLECGAQLPRFAEDQRKLPDGAQPIHNNCSGKHAGFVAFSKHAEIDPIGYIGLEHPVQREIAHVMETVIDHPHNADNHGIDGCSIPTFAIPLQKLAIAFAKFAVADDPSPSRAAAMTRLRDACLAFPYMVAGRKRVCTELMQALGTRAFVKVGAEGVYTASLPEVGLGVAMKARDGNFRAVEVAVCAVVSQFLELTEPETVAMKPLLRPVIKNWNGLNVGSARINL